MSDQPTRVRLEAARAREAAKRNRDRARKKLLGKRRELAVRHARNRARNGTDDGEDDRNPSTHSTVPSGDDAASAAARAQLSTVPRRPRYSRVDPGPRLYGLGLYRAARGETDE